MKLKIITPKGEAESIRVALHSGIVYFLKERVDDARITDSFTLKECEIIIEE
jgi:hypothetical protein